MRGRSGRGVSLGGGGCQGGCERRCEVIVKIQKKTGGGGRVRETYKCNAQKLKKVEKNID